MVTHGSIWPTVASWLQLGKNSLDGVPFSTTLELHRAAVQGYNDASEIEDPADRSREMRQWWDRLRKLPEQQETDDRILRVEEAANRLESVGAPERADDTDTGRPEASRGRN